MKTILPRKLVFRSLLLGLVAITLSACGTSTASNALGTGSSSSGSGLDGRTLKVAHDVSFPPFEFQSNGQYVGFDLDLINAIATKANFKINFMPMDFSGIIPALQAKQIDLSIAAMTIKPARQQVIDFSLPYFKTGISIAVRSDNNSISKPEDLKGKSVGVKLGTSGEALIRALPYAKDIKIRTFDSNDATYLAVQNGNVDATVNDETTLLYYISDAGKGKMKTVGALLTGDTYGIGVPKGNPDVLKAVNDGLKAVTADGTYATLYKKWFGVLPTVIPGQY